MKIWKNWLQKVNDPTRDIYDRRFRGLGLFYVVLLFVWMVISSVLFFHPARTVLFLITETGFVLIYLQAVRHDRTQPAAVVCSAMIVLVMMPVNYFVNGGVSSGPPFWSLIALAFITMMVKGRIRTVLIVTDLIITAMLHLTAYYYPGLIREIDRDRSYANSFVSVLFTGVIVLAAFLFQAYTEQQGRRILEEQRDEIRELNRSQNRFFSSMSHEIRTPINTIIGLNEINMRDGNISDEIRINNRNIQGASRMLLTLINDILDMSKMESGKMEIVPVTYDVGALLSEVINMILSRAEEKKLAFHVDVDESLPSGLYGDEVRIKQVLINLLNNAVKYTKEGSVRMTVQGDRLNEKEISVTWRVEDTGMGIRKEAIPYLFDAFKRVDEEANRNIEGTGLGLSIVKQITDLMGGEISVDSVYTRGSTFTFSVVQEIVNDTPVGQISLQKSRYTTEQDTYHQSFEAPDASLLIVDDNDLNLQVESRLLQATRMQIDLATSGKECLSMVFRKKYDVIFMDHLMPEMDGIETLNAIRMQRGGLNRETPVVVLTANAGSENQALYASSGFDDYLLKPVSGSQMESALLHFLPKEKVIIADATTVQGTDKTFTGRHRARRRMLISTESGADIPRKLAVKYLISVISSYVHTDRGTFYDNRDVDADGLLEYLDDAANTAKSEPPSVSDYEYFFAEQLARAQQVIHITFDKNLSMGYSRAMEAATAFDNVHIFDSGSLSSGTGLLALYAAHRAEAAEDASQLIKRLSEVKEQIHTSFVVNDTFLLSGSGRVSEPVFHMLNALVLHPMIQIGKGGMKVGALFSGERERYRAKYIRKVLKNAEMIDTSLLFVTYAGMTQDELSEIRSLIEDEIVFDRIIFQKASSAVALNCGRGTVGLLYRIKGEGEDAKPLFHFLPREIGHEEEEEKYEEQTGEIQEAAEEVLPGMRRNDETISEAIVSSLPLTDLEQLYRASGTLDYQEAMRYLDGEELMLKTIRAFYDDITKNADEIERLLADDDYENYTIKVHALKSAARLIGATALSKDAAKLEEYGKLIRS